MLDTDRLTLANYMAESRDWDFAEADNWRVVQPTVTEAALDQYWPEWREECDDLADARDEFPNAEGYSAYVEETEESNYPMMMILWPLDLPYGGSAEDAADAIAAEGLACCLIEESHRGDDETYGIALTGGGMNLADHIAAAYVLAGSVPPINVLEGMPSPSNVSAETFAAIKAATARLADHMVWKAGKLKEKMDLIDRD